MQGVRLLHLPHLRKQDAPPPQFSSGGLPSHQAHKAMREPPIEFSSAHVVGSARILSLMALPFSGQPLGLMIQN